MRADRQAQVKANLEDRVSISLLLGNDMKIAYPVGLAYHFTRLLDSLRYYAIKVRITFAGDHYTLPIEGEIFKGHLRRYAGDDQQQDTLALHRKFDDQDSLKIIEFMKGTTRNDYDRISRIECIDPLLLGDGNPVTFWEASEAQQSAWAAKRRQSLTRERRHATFFLLHVAAVLAVIVAMFVPVVRAWAAGERWKAIGWCVAAFVMGMLVMGTLIVWDVVLGDAPAVSVLWRNDPCDDLGQPPAS